MRILIVGAGGLIGAACHARLSEIGHDIIATTRAGVSGTIAMDVERPAESWHLPACDATIICAALTSLKTCEDFPERAERINHGAVADIVQIVARTGGHPILLSTSQVFDGSVRFPRPDSPPTPRTVYGETKSRAEAACLAHDGTVLRLTKVLGPRVEIMERWRGDLSQGITIEAFEDLVMAPVGLGHAVDAILAIVEDRMTGIHHLSADRDISYYALAKELARSLGRPAELVLPASFERTGLPATFAPPRTALGIRQEDTKSRIPQVCITETLSPYLRSI